jgi:hypothetical protein
LEVEDNYCSWKQRHPWTNYGRNWSWCPQLIDGIGSPILSYTPVKGNLLRPCYHPQHFSGVLFLYYITDDDVSLEKITDI